MNPSHPKQATHWLPDMTAAALCTIVTLAYAGSFGQLIFGGALAPMAGRAVLAALITGICANIVLSWRSSFAFTQGGADSNPSAILATTVASIAALIPVEAELLPTVLAYLFGSALICGLFVVFVGKRGWGRYVRFIPYPVIGGFLAGTGYLLVAGAFKMMTGHKLTWRFFHDFSDVRPLFWVTATVVASALFFISRRFKHYLIVPAIIVAAIAVFHGVRLMLGLDLETARSGGLLLAPLQLGEWSTWGNLDYGLVRWDILFSHIQDIGAMTMVVIVATLLNTTSLEHASGLDGDADQELRAVGWGNVATSALGGFVGMLSFNRSWLGRNAGATTPWAGRFSALMAAGIVLFAPQTVGWLPRPVLTGLILYLGVNLLVTWLWEARKKMLVGDHLIVIAIVAVIAGFGAVPGVASGIIIACVSLAFTLSRNPAIRYRFSARTRHANVERAASEQEFLREAGHELEGFVLQGILFFGTVNRVLEDVRESLERIRLLLLDFRLVHGVDGSAAVVLKRLQTLCRDAGVRLVFTGLTPATESSLARGGVDFSDKNVRCFTDLDLGLEWCEDRILARSNDTTAPFAIDGAAMSGEDMELLGAFERREIADGELLMRRGDPGDQMFVLVRGRVQVQISLSLEGKTVTKRLRTFGPGTLVGEMGFYSKQARSADIICTADASVICISDQRLNELESVHPGFANRLHRYVIGVMTLRLRPPTTRSCSCCSGRRD